MHTRRNKLPSLAACTNVVVGVEETDSRRGWCRHIHQPPARNSRRRSLAVELKAQSTCVGSSILPQCVCVCVHAYCVLDVAGLVHKAHVMPCPSSAHRASMLECQLSHGTCQQQLAQLAGTSIHALPWWWSIHTLCRRSCCANTSTPLVSTSILGSMQHTLWHVPYILRCSLSITHPQFPSDTTCIHSTYIVGGPEAELATTQHTQMHTHGAANEAYTFLAHL